jgi:hypothetical protein
MKLIRKMFSKKEEKHEVKLGKSVRGVGRSIAENGISGAIALGRGKKAADKAAKEGKSEAEVIDAAGRKAKRTMRAMEAGATAAGLGVAAVAGRGVTKAIGKNKDKIAKVAKEVADQVKLKADGFAVDNKSFLGKTGKLVQSARATNEAKAIRDLGANIIKNRSKIGAGVAAVLGAGVLARGAAKAFKKGRLAENAAHKNTIERIKDGKKKEKNYSVIQPQDIKLYSKSKNSEKVKAFTFTPTEEQLGVKYIEKDIIDGMRYLKDHPEDKGNDEIKRSIVMNAAYLKRLRSNYGYGSLDLDEIEKEAKKYKFK